MKSEKPKISLRNKARPSDREAVRKILLSNKYFFDFEIAVAEELIEERLTRGPVSGYHFFFAEIENRVVGYACYGPIPCTQKSFDLYWMAVSEELRGQGIGSRILAETEKAILKLGGERVYIETSSRPDYGPTRRFYEKTNYRLASRLDDFYAPGDAKLTWEKNLAAIAKA
ncbi:MAG: GNAT family N-acetyltransferase [Proteobacteria bacterium]|nr:GNAT family N-acetyltransferase [Pseudomonadota bacterium]